MVTDELISEFRAKLASARLDDGAFSRLARVILRQGCGAEPSKELAAALQRKDLLHYFEPLCKAFTESTGIAVNMESLLPVAELPKKPKTNPPTTAAPGVLIGVKRAKNGKFTAKIKINGKNVYVGTFDTAMEAALEFNRLAKLHPSTRQPRKLNFIVDALACTKEPVVPFTLKDKAA